MTKKGSAHYYAALYDTIRKERDGLRDALTEAEKERDEAREAVKNLRARNRAMEKSYLELKAERDEARDELARWSAGKLAAALARAEKERDEARRRVQYEQEMTDARIQAITTLCRKADERLEKVREAFAYERGTFELVPIGKASESDVRNSLDRLDRALNETASEKARCGGTKRINRRMPFDEGLPCPGCPDCAARCATCGSNDPEEFAEGFRIGPDYCPDPFHTSEGEK